MLYEYFCVLGAAGVQDEELSLSGAGFRTLKRVYDRLSMLAAHVQLIWSFKKHKLCFCSVVLSASEFIEKKSSACCS